MKVNEFRLGNLIDTDYPILDKTIVVGIISRTKINGVDISKFKPILLTEEWLLKFGFDKNDELNFVNFSFTVHFWSNNNSYMYNWIGGNIELKYVHQLQNLYFALTNKELILNN